MGFDNKERSRHSGRPVNLLRFQWSADEGGVAGYTDSVRVITFDGVAYQPIAVSVPSIKSNALPERSRVEFNLPQDVPLAELYRGYPPSEITTVRLFQGHTSDPTLDFKLVWAGRVLGVKFTPQSAIFLCEPVSSALARVGLRRPWSVMCPHVLFGAHCRANKQRVTTTIVVEDIGDVGPRDILMPEDFPTVQAPEFLTGMVEWVAGAGVQRRSIVDVDISSNTGGRVRMVLTGPTTGLGAGMSVDVVKGCNHQVDHCLLVHDNIHNYGGFPFINGENPTAGRLNGFY